MIDLAAKEQEILGGLKDFQLATVNRVAHLFSKGFRRVLVADEVGLGKTLIARGIIARLARSHHDLRNNDLFKVVYVCSNQSIAGQNLKKLKIHTEVKVDGLSDTRLSMQHLKIYEQMNDPKIKESLVQLIPLTPGTSFSMTGGCGSVLERALIYAILKRIPFFKPFLSQLNTLMMSYARKSWPGWKAYYETEVVKCDTKSKGVYLNKVLDRVEEQINEDIDLCALAGKVLTSVGQVGYERSSNTNYLILRLRKMMAEISVEMMDADLVIMDEFQRFPELIKQDKDNETAMLAQKFFNSGLDLVHHPCILLLSATPYKLYSTIEEIKENRKDEHYKEFMQVVGFLFEHQPEQKESFSTAWSNYSMMLNEASYQNTAMIIAQKQKAEASLYNGVCRTERIKVPGAVSLIDSEIKKSELTIHEEDILTYVEIDKMLAELGISDAAPVEFIKSAPLIMSFMQHYKLKQKLTDQLKAQPEKLPLLRSRLLWVNKDHVAKYKPLTIKHARFNKLQEVAMPQQAEKLLWIPPSRPYYELGGPFRHQKGFSKTLVFSAWEMVPRAIAALLSMSRNS